LDTHSEDSASLFYKDIIESGRDINDNGLVKTFIKKSSEVENKLSKYGITFKKINNSLLKKRPPGHSMPRLINSDYHNSPYLIKGLSITRPLLNKLKNYGVKIINNTLIIKLLVSDSHKVYGALGINKKTGKIIIFYSKLVILASGGGNIFSKSTNTNDITSDSYSLAYNAGALLRDMEFAQFYPTMMYKPIRTTIANSLFYEGAILKNSFKENFMNRYDKAGNMATRDVMSRAIFTEIISGRGIDGNVFMDCNSVSESVFKSKYAELYQTLERKGIDCRKDFLLITPAYHFFIGGIVINSKTETSLKGLLSCGEAVGGLHGANRLAGNALSEAIVFGFIAGQNALKLVKEKDNIVIPQTHNRLTYNFQGKLSPKELKMKLRQTMWDYSSIVKEKNSLEKAKKEIYIISDALRDVSIKNIGELVLFYELKSMLTTSKLVIEGALRRKESRGSHYRSDYPDMNDIKFKGNHYFRKEKDMLNIYFRPI
jgi:aspartate oxidase